MGIETAIVLGTMAAAGGGMAVKARKDMKKKLSQAPAPVKPAETMEKEARQTADAAAMKRKRAMQTGGKTIFTSPLGAGEGVNVYKQKLGG